MTRKKSRTNIPRTSRTTGAIILIVFCSIVALVVAFSIYSLIESTKQTDEENRFRQMPCNEMKLQFDKDPALWKWNALTDKGCL